MKTFIRTIILACLAGFFTACNEDPEYYTLDSQPDEMHIQASVDRLILNKGIANQPAITFTWDAQPSPISADDQVTYAVRLYASANKDDFVTSLYDVGDARQFSLTHEELNNIIGRWVVAGQQVRVTAQVLSSVHNELKYVKPASSTVEFDVIGYERFPQYIYIHLTDDVTGEVTTESLSQRELGTGVYEATLDVVPCTYYFTTTTEPLPAYGQADGEKMVYVTEGDVPAFTCEEIGTRTFIVDTNPEYNDCRLLDIIQLPTEGVIWIVGTGTSVGWNPNDAAGKMTMTGGAREPYIYSWTGDFFKPEDAVNDSPGQFKIGLGGGWGDQFFYAPSPDTNPAEDHGIDGPRYENGMDYKWLSPVTGHYKFSVYLLRDDFHTSFEPAE
ncbi:MAG: SusE domain-containing protein [Prevotella sp.]|nr:SusE domain-containing protein [Prevotella sp.]